jgi:hypothetical protein
MKSEFEANEPDGATLATCAASIATISSGETRSDPPISHPY